MTVELQAAQWMSKMQHGGCDGAVFVDRQSGSCQKVDGRATCQKGLYKALMVYSMFRHLQRGMREWVH